MMSPRSFGFLVGIVLATLSPPIKAADENAELIDIIGDKILAIDEILPAQLKVALHKDQDRWLSEYDRVCKPERPTKSCTLRAGKRLEVLRMTWLEWKRAKVIREWWFSPVLKHLTSVENQLAAALPAESRDAFREESARWAEEVKLKCRAMEEGYVDEAALFRNDRRVRNRSCSAEEFQSRAIELDMRLESLVPSRSPFWTNRSCVDWVDGVESISAATLASDQNGVTTSSGSLHVEPNSGVVAVHFWLDGYDANVCEGNFNSVPPDARNNGTAASITSTDITLTDLETDQLEPACKFTIHATPNFLHLTGNLDECSRRVGCGHRIVLPKVIPLWKENYKIGPDCSKKP